MTYPWGDTRRFNSYAGYFRRLFGCRVQKLAVDAGFTCPNRDGTIGEGGCTFCNNGAFTPSYCMPSKSVGQQIAEGIEFHRNRYRSAQRYLVYFQAFSNTYAPLERLKRLYDEALAHPGVVVERFASEAPPRYHYGRNWGLVRNEQLLAMLEKRLEERNVYQGEIFTTFAADKLRQR